MKKELTVALALSHKPCKFIDNTFSGMTLRMIPHKITVKVFKQAL